MKQTTGVKSGHLRRFEGIIIALIWTSRKLFNFEYLWLQWVLYFSLSTKKTWKSRYVSFDFRFCYV